MHTSSKFSAEQINYAKATDLCKTTPKCDAYIDQRHEAEEALLKWAYTKSLGFARTNKEIETVMYVYQNRKFLKIRRIALDLAMRLDAK